MHVIYTALTTWKESTKVGYVIFCLNGSGPTEGFLCFRTMRTNRPWYQPSPSHNHSGKDCLITFHMTREGFWVEKPSFSNARQLRFWN